MNTIATGDGSMGSGLGFGPGATRNSSNTARCNASETGSNQPRDRFMRLNWIRLSRRTDTDPAAVMVADIEANPPASAGTPASGHNAARRYRACWIADSSQCPPPVTRMKVHNSVAV